MLENKNILLVITGGIAAYKSLELIRFLKKAKANINCILTNGGAQFVTPLSVSALCENEVFTDLWSLKDETEMGHIRLSRETDLIVVAPASADFIAKMAHGYANDLASTCLLASDKPILVAPAMNHKMWDNQATKENITTLRSRGLLFCGPESGDMACGEHGIGRLSEPEAIFDRIENFFRYKDALKGMRAVITSGPTYEPIDPVRFIGNRSSGKQGQAIAEALSLAGADVHLITGPVNIPPPSVAKVTRVETAQEMLEATEAALPCEIFIGAAAVSDWRAEMTAGQKIKKEYKATPQIEFAENPDILQQISKHSSRRPSLVIGFAAETENLEQNAKNKINKKGCDWLLANNVASQKKVFGTDENYVILFQQGISSNDDWGQMTKSAIAQKLVSKIIDELKNGERNDTSTILAAE